MKRNGKHPTSVGTRENEVFIYGHLISCVKQLGERRRLPTRAPPPPSGRLGSARFGSGLGSRWRASGLDGGPPAR